MIQDFDFMNRAEKPSFTLCNPNKTELYSLDTCYDTSLKIRFNAISELDFTFPQKIGEVIFEAYDYIQVKRLVKVENLGYFIILDAEEESEGNVNLKKVKCVSLEAELISKKITGFGGMYDLKNPFEPTDILRICFGSRDAYVPNWTVGYVSSTLVGSNVSKKRRSFKISDSSVYEFITGEVATAFDCLFIFDTTNRVVNVYDKNDVLHDTDIYLSYDNLITHSTFSEKSDEIVTCLRVYGGGDLDIRTVNPLGGVKVYKFDYYKNLNWMSQGLIDALDIWIDKVEDAKVDYANRLTALKNLYGTFVDGVPVSGLVLAEAELTARKAAYNALEAQIKALIEAGNQPGTALSDQLEAARQAVNAQVAECERISGLIKSATDGLATVHTSLSFATNFTDTQFAELVPYIIENTYQNQNFIQTDLMTNEEIQEMAQALYDQVMVPSGILDRVSQPRYEFEIDSVNFLFLPEFQPFIDQLELGAIATINTGSNFNIKSYLLEIDYSYDNPDDFKLIFSNRLRLDNGDFIFADLFGNPIKVGSEVNFNSELWSNWNDIHKNDVTEFLNSVLSAANNEIISSTDQDIVINQNGLKARKKTHSDSHGNPVFDDKQLWLTSNMIAFTDNNWETTRLALGSIRMPDDMGGGYQYGLAGDVLVGKLIAGNSLVIANGDSFEQSTFYVGPRGVKIDNMNLDITSNHGQNRVRIGPDDAYPDFPIGGIKIQKLEGGQWRDKLWLDNDGNVQFGGMLNGPSGKIGEWNIGLKTSSPMGNGFWEDTYGNYILSNGKVKLGKLEIDGDTATFDGNIYARNIQDTVPDSKIGSISASKITAGIITATVTLQSPQLDFGYRSGGTFNLSDQLNIIPNADPNSRIVTLHGASIKEIISGGHSYGDWGTSAIRLVSSDNSLYETINGNAVNMSNKSYMKFGGDNLIVDSAWTSFNSGFSTYGDIYIHQSTSSNPAGAKIRIYDADGNGYYASINSEVAVMAANGTPLYLDFRQGFFIRAHT